MGSTQNRKIVPINWFLVLIVAIGSFLAIDQLRQLRAKGPQASAPAPAPASDPTGGKRQRADSPPGSSVVSATVGEPTPKQEKRPMTRAEAQVEAMVLFADLRSKGLVRIAGAGPSVPMPFEMMGKAALDGQFAAVTVDNTGRLHPRFGELFGLDEPTLATLQQAVLRVKANMDEVVAAEAKVQVLPDQVVIELPPNPLAGAARDETLQAFQTALGPERYDLWVALVSNGPTGPEGLMRSFGATGLTYTIKPTPAPRGGGDGRPRYSVSSRGGGSFGGLDREGLLKVIGPAANGVPAEF